jgi:hypothetical protein
MLSSAMRWSLKMWTVAAWMLPENWPAFFEPWTNVANSLCPPWARRKPQKAFRPSGKVNSIE